MFDKEAMRLRKLADAIDRRDLVLKYLGEYGNQVGGDVKVDWGAAASCAGFSETRSLAVHFVRDVWPDIAAKIRSRVEQDVENARAELERLSPRAADSREDT